MHMDIVLEGFDNTGKSTLAAVLSRELTMPIVASEGPPKYPGEIIERVTRYLSVQDPRIFDRHPCVSQPIYGLLRGNNQRQGPMKNQIEEFYRRNPILIYCKRDTPTLEGHVLKDHDDERHMRQVTRNVSLLARAYEDWAATHAHITYVLGDDHMSVVSQIKELMK